MNHLSLRGAVLHGAAIWCAMLAGCGGSTTKHGPVDAILAAFIPPDTTALAGVHMDRVRETPLYRKLAERHRLPDLSSQIQELLIAWDGRNVLAVARGAFQGNAPGEGITYAGKNIALSGPDAAVRAAIRQSENGGRGAPRDLMARAQSLPAAAQIWVVMAGWPGLSPGQVQALGNLGNLDRVMRLVESAGLTVDLSAGIHAAFTGNSRTEADAQNLADSLRGLAAVARLGAPRGVPEGQSDLLRALDGIQVKQEGRVVRVDIAIAEDLAEKMIR